MLSQTSTSLLIDLRDPRNERAWQRFFARYTPMLLSYAKRVGLTDADAQDVVGDTLATFVQAYWAGRYQRDRGRLKSWLGGMVYKKVLKSYARRRAVSLDAGQSADGRRTIEPVAPDDQAEAFEREWQLELLSQGLDILRRESDPNTYQAFDLYALKGWPVAKVTKFLDMTPNAVYISKTRLLKRLRKIIRQIQIEEELPPAPGL